MKNTTWLQYEQTIHDHFARIYPECEIQHNVHIKGRYSGINRQIDILIEGYLAGNRLQIMIETKFFSQKINVKHVEMFIGMLGDCGANKGILITSKGFSPAAINRAHYDPADLDLDILNFEDLTHFQNFGGIPFKDNYGVVTTAPFGWILDAEPRPGMLATFYQRGLTFEGAVSAWEWMYVNICLKDKEFKNTEDLIQFQNKETLQLHAGATITFRPTVKRENIPIKLRVIDTADFQTQEFTGFVEFEDFIFFCVLFTPKELEQKNIRKLEEVLLLALPVRMIQREAQNESGH